jgi:hypothetical protein
VGDLEMKEWFRKLFYNEYEIIVWDSTAMKTFYLRKISKISHNEIKGVDMDKKYFEYKTVEPFNYKIRKLH